MRDENQLHAAVVELIALDDATIKYSTVQNWYPGDKEGKGGIYNFVTKRGKCRGENCKDLLDPGRNRLRHHLEISELHPAGRQQRRRILLRRADQPHQQADTGTKMIHIGKNTKSTIVSKGISAGNGQNTYRGLVKILKGAKTRATTRSAIRCCSATSAARTRSRISKCKNTTRARRARSLDFEDRRRPDLLLQASAASRREDAVNMIVNGFCKEVFRELPMEFAVEAQKLLGVSLEGSVG